MRFQNMDFQITDRLLRDFPKVTPEEVIDTVVREANYKLEQTKIKERLKGKRK